MDFRKWFEAAALQDPRLATSQGGGTNDNDHDDGDGGGDHDPEWSLNAVLKKYGGAIQNWVDHSDFSKKCKSKVIEMLFKTNPRVGDVEIIHHRENEVPINGYASLRIQWFLPESQVFDPLFNTLRDASKCDLWKAFQVDARSWWNFLDKGEVYEAVYHVFVLSLSGSRHAEPAVDKTQQNWGQAWAAQHREWWKDKLTIGKYARFVAQEKETDYDELAKSHIMQEFAFIQKQHPKGAEIWLHEAPRGRGQLYGDNFEADISYLWQYRIEI